MKAQINGQSADIPEGYTVADLLLDQGLAGRRVAVELNGNIVPRSHHDRQPITDGDRLEIVHAIGGGSI